MHILGMFHSHLPVTFIWENQDTLPPEPFLSTLCTCVVAVVKLATSCICFCDEQVDREFEREVARFNQ